MVSLKWCNFFTVSDFRPCLNGIIYLQIRGIVSPCFMYRISFDAIRSPVQRKTF